MSHPAPSDGPTAAAHADLGVVVIGRNEGERLERCFTSLGGVSRMIVYVDSGSTDASVSVAKQIGIEVVELDLTTPFTAARARNAGVRRLLEVQPGTRFVQFVDGDCEVAAGWLARGSEVLAREDHVAAVCGRNRERFPQASIYNRLCDIEWDATLGDVPSCGGNVMMRVAAFEEAGGFRSSMVAGEEPELCLRLRARQWRILRIDAEMTLHDAAIFRFSQWWRRSVRAGHAFAEAAWLHRGVQALRRVASIVWWAALLPAVALALAWPTRGASLTALPLAYALLWVRVYVVQRRRRESKDAALYAAFVVIGKFAELCGMTRFAFSKLLRRRARIIDYKSSQALPSAMPETP